VRDRQIKKAEETEHRGDASMGSHAIEHGRKEWRSEGDLEFRWGCRCCGEGMTFGEMAHRGNSKSWNVNEAKSHTKLQICENHRRIVRDKNRGRRNAFFSGIQTEKIE
jgi:hypothetical protein